MLTVSVAPPLVQQHTTNVSSECSTPVIQQHGTSYVYSDPMPKCIPIKPSRKAVNILSSSQINQAELIDPNTVIKKYSNYCSLSRVLTLAQRLASESYFGDNVLEKCTVMGCRDNPALPLKELNELKQIIFSLFPQFWGNSINLKILGQPVPMPLVNAEDRGRKRKRIPIATISDTEGDSHYVAVIYVYKLYKLLCDYTYHCNRF